MTVFIAEGMAEAGQRILTEAGVTIVTPSDVYDPIAVECMIVRSVYRVDHAALARFPRLRVVAKLGTGLDNVDVDACRAAEIIVMSVPGMNSVSTAEFTVLQVLASWKRAYEIHTRVRARDYRRALYHGRELAHTTAGVIGYGSVGKHVVDRLRPFVRSVRVYDRAQASKCAITVGNIEFITTLDALIPEVDILVLCVTLAGNERMVDAEFLTQCRDRVLIVNTARGGLIDNQALMAFLSAHPEAQYVCDVIDPEPDYALPPDRQTYRHPLLELPNVTFTPHIANLTPECQDRIARTIATRVLGSLAMPSLIRSSASVYALP